MRWLFLGVVALMLAGCTVRLPVTGQIDRTGERFTGTVLASPGRDGTLSVSNDAGLQCDGEYVVISSREGRGTLRCTDGRLGSYDFVAVGDRGTGHGKIRGDDFTFSFGR